MTNARYRPALLLVLSLTVTTAGADGQHPFDADVLDVRPRVFLRSEPFAGLTVEKLRRRVDQPQLAHSRQVP